MSRSSNPIEAALVCSKRYTFSTDTIIHFCGERYKNCFPTLYNTPSAPSILTMQDAFGEKAVAEWMENNLMILSELAGNKEKLTYMQIQFAASCLISKFTGEQSPQDRLNAAEVLLFFKKIVSGDFGVFYGAVNILTIGKWANEFLDWRHDERARLEDEQRREAEFLKAREMEKCPEISQEQKQLLHDIVKSFHLELPAAIEDTPELRKTHEQEFLSRLTEEQREEYLKRKPQG